MNEYKSQVETIRELVADTFPTVDGRPSNGALLEPAGIVSWGGFSLTLACLYGVAKALQWDDGWDYFINLSSADYPVLTQVRYAGSVGRSEGEGGPRTHVFLAGVCQQVCETNDRASSRRESFVPIRAIFDDKLITFCYVANCRSIFLFTHSIRFSPRLPLQAHFIIGGVCVYRGQISCSCTCRRSPSYVHTSFPFLAASVFCEANIILHIIFEVVLQWQRIAYWLS